MSDYVVDIKPSARRANGVVGSVVHRRGPERRFEAREDAEAWAAGLSERGGRIVWIRTANPDDRSDVDAYLVSRRPARGASAVPLDEDDRTEGSSNGAVHGPLRTTRPGASEDEQSTDDGRTADDGQAAGDGGSTDDDRVAGNGQPAGDGGSTDDSRTADDGRPTTDDWFAVDGRPTSEGRANGESNSADR